MLLVPDWTRLVGGLGRGDVHALEQGCHRESRSKKTRRAKGEGKDSKRRGEREELKGGNKSTEFLWQIPCLFVTVTGFRHPSYLVTLKLLVRIR